MPSPKLTLLNCSAPLHRSLIRLAKLQILKLPETTRKIKHFDKTFGAKDIARGNLEGTLAFSTYEA
jgi:hypothetical protein